MPQSSPWCNAAHTVHVHIDQVLFSALSGDAMRSLRISAIFYNTLAYSYSYIHTHIVCLAFFMLYFCILLLVKPTDRSIRTHTHTAHILTHTLFNEANIYCVACNIQAAFEIYIKKKKEKQRISAANES